MPSFVPPKQAEGLFQKRHFAAPVQPVAYFFTAPKLGAGATMLKPQAVTHGAKPGTPGKKETNHPVDVP